jgi:hypothetical protein
MSFDYVSAWNKLANPARLNITPDCAALLSRVIADGGNWRQGANLDVPFPDDALKNAFYNIPSPDLARAARAVYYWGHWCPLGEDGPPHGAHWKFSNLADQVLSERLGLPRGMSSGQGVSHRVHQGFLRVQCSTLWVWLWEEYGPATAPILDTAQQVQTPPQPTVRRNWEKSWDAFHEAVPGYLDRVHGSVSLMLSDTDKAFLTAGETFVEASQ